MKPISNIISILLGALMLLVWLSSCEKPTDPDYSNKYDDRGGSFVPTTALVTFKASQVAATEAWSGGSFENTFGPSVIKKGVCWSTSAGPTINANCTDQGTGHTQFSSKLEPLSPGTAYFIRAYAVHEGGAVVYGNQEQFATLAAPPNVTTSAVTQVGTTTATAGGNVTGEGSSPVTARGVCYSTTQNPTTANSCTSNGTGTGSFTANLSALTAGTTYYVRAYATNPIGTTYGTQISFTTLTSPTVITGSITNITSIGATVAANVSADGGSTVTDRGICYATSQNPTTSDTCVVSGSGTGEFSANLTDLSAVTTYFVRAYATNTVMTSYGAQASFVTAALLPTVNTGSVSGLGATTATVSGEVTSDGGATVSARGICYSTTQNPTTANSCVASGSGTGTFSATLTGLDPGTTYYVRAYGSNIEGTAYGAQASFVSLPTLPIVTIVSVTGITSSGATVAGEVTATGGVTVSTRGVCYSTTQNPTLSGTCVASGSGIGSFVAPIAGLSRLTAYYVRAYATNSEGTTYGSQRSFTTLPDLPKVISFSTSEITPNSAKLDGRVTDTGGDSKTMAGFCWGTMPNIPVDWDVCVGIDYGLGDFAYTVRGLTTGVRYYWAAYATNRAGTTWSSVSNFIPR